MSMASSPASINLSSPYTQSAANTPWTPQTPHTPQTPQTPWTPSTPRTPQTPFTPGGAPQTPTEDHVIERVVLPVYSDYKCSNKIGEFKYGKKQSDKFVCLTDNCKIKFSKANKIKTQGVSLQTLKSHSLQHHSIELKPREMKAFQSAPLLCEFCSQSFARAQTLKTHIRNKHRETAINSHPPQLNSNATDNDRFLVDNQPVEDMLAQAITEELHPNQIEAVQNIINEDSQSNQPSDDLLEFVQWDWSLFNEETQSNSAWA